MKRIPILLLAMLSLLPVPDLAAMDGDDSDSDIDNLIFKADPDIKPAESDIDLVLNAPDAAALADLLKNKQLRNNRPDWVLEILVESAEDSGYKLDEKIDYLINQFNRSNRAVLFSDPHALHTLIHNYNDKNKDKLPRWIEWFMKYGAPVDQAMVYDKSGYTALDWAVRYNNLAAAKVLFNRAAFKTEEALKYAQQKGFTEIVNLLKENILADQLRSSTDGAQDLQLIDECQDLAQLKRALLVVRDEIPVTRLVPIYNSLMKRIDLLDQDKIQVQFKESPHLINQVISTASEDDLFGWTEWFLERNAPADSASALGYTPLDGAIERKRADIVTLLLKFNANPNQVVDKLTPLQYARSLQAAASENDAKTFNNIVELLEHPERAKQPPVSKFSFMRTKAFLASVVAATGLALVYRWFASRWSTGQSQDILINNTAAPIDIVLNNERPTPVDSQQSWPGKLPQSGILIIKKSADLKKSEDLKIDLGAYAKDRTDYYLNLSIRPTTIFEKWILGYKTAMYYSETWVKKPKKEELK